MSDGPTVEVIADGPLSQEAIEALARLLLLAAAEREPKEKCDP